MGNVDWRVPMLAMERIRSKNSPWWACPGSVIGTLVSAAILVSPSSHAAVVVTQDVNRAREEFHLLNVSGQQDVARK